MNRTLFRITQRTFSKVYLLRLMIVSPQTDNCREQCCWWYGTISHWLNKQPALWKRTLKVPCTKRGHNICCRVATHTITHSLKVLAVLVKLRSVNAIAFSAAAGLLYVCTMYVRTYSIVQTPRSITGQARLIQLTKCVRTRTYERVS